MGNIYVEGRGGVVCVTRHKIVPPSLIIVGNTCSGMLGTEWVEVNCRVIHFKS